MEATTLNEAQLEMLKLMSVIKTPEELAELKQAISDHFVRKAAEEIDRMWADGRLTEERVESFRHLHERTPYRP
jgi:hypothetical protein